MTYEKKIYGKMPCPMRDSCDIKRCNGRGTIRVKLYGRSKKISGSQCEAYVNLIQVPKEFIQDKQIYGGLENESKS